MKWFLKEGLSPHQTALAMIGIKPGGSVVVIGAGDGILAAELARITGLNGRTLVVDPASGAESRVAAAAADTGVLVDFAQTRWTALPDDASGADVAVVNCQLAACGPAAKDVLAEAVRIIRPGGRVVVLEGAARRGVFSRFSAPAGPAPLPGDAVRELLTSSGLRATRVLGEERGVTFIEGVRSVSEGT